MAERKPAKTSPSQAKAAKPTRRSAMNISAPRRAKASKPKTQAKPTKPAKASTAKAPAEKTTAKAAAKTSASVAAGGRKKAPPAPNMQERMEGLQGWMAEIERKQGRMTRFGGGAALLAVLAAGGAIALGVINQQNAATSDDLDELTKDVNALGSSVKAQTEQGLKKLNTRLSALETEITTLQTQQAKDAQDIAALQQSQAAAASTVKGGGTGLTPAVPGPKP